jgi:hypothetical protein
VNITGQKFNQLTAVEWLGKRWSKSGKSHAYLWRCICTCGSETFAVAKQLIRGKHKSCGCDRRARGFKKLNPHTYASYKSMMARCHDLGSMSYSNYGGRGSTCVCAGSNL